MTIEEIAKAYSVLIPCLLDGSAHVSQKLKDYCELDAEIKILTGHDFKQLRTLFAAGYTLKPPDPPLTMSQLIAEFEKGEN